MKNRILNITSVVIFSLIFMACSTDDDSNNSESNSSSTEQAASTAQSGTWSITYFFDSDKDETSNFSGYSFKFNEDGSLIATKGNTTVSGTWSVTNDSSSSSSSHDDFNIFFNVPESSDFDDLIDDWDIISVTSNMIQLTDVSGGNGGTDFLTFEKN